MSSVALKVMSFNIRYGTAPDGDHHWEHRKHLVLERIQAFEPDLLGLQECRDDAQARFIQTMLPGYFFYGIKRGGADDTSLEMAPVLFRRESFQPLQTGCFWLSETPQISGSKSWDSTFARTVTWVRLLHLATGRELTFLNTHFDYHPPAITGAADLLCTWIRHNQPDTPLILTGDFNTNKDSAEYRRLTMDCALFDTHPRYATNPEAEATFHGFGQAEALSAIDWILVSDHFQVLSAMIDRTRQGLLFPSDHYPVCATLHWQMEDIER